MLRLKNILDRQWWAFAWHYFRRRTPWDTNVTPPEVVEFMAENSPGRALDLGCGTGTNAIALAQKGWEVTGIDFSAKAIRMARKKAAKAGLSIDFRMGDVADLSGLTGLYDYALDIGCLFTLKPKDRQSYVSGLSRLVRPGGRYMLYAWLPRPDGGDHRGLTPEEVKALFEPDFKEEKTIIGREKGRGSAWYWLVREQAADN